MSDLKVSGLVREDEDGTRPRYFLGSHRKFRVVRDILPPT
jgi:hypothetical protein